MTCVGDTDLLERVLVANRDDTAYGEKLVIRSVDRLTARGPKHL